MTQQTLSPCAVVSLDALGAGLKMTADDPRERARVTEHMNSVFDLAHDLEAPIIGGGGGGVRALPANLDRDVGVSRVLEVLGNSARRAEVLGVAIGPEAINRYETNLGRMLAECKRYVQAIGSPALKVVGDTFHMNRRGIDGRSDRQRRSVACAPASGR